jgi:hypothetical protein
MLTNADYTMINADSTMIRQAMSTRRRYHGSLAERVRAAPSVNTAGNGDCFIISLLFGISFSKGTYWLFQKLEPLLGERTTVTADNILCVHNDELEVHDELVDKFRAELKAKLLFIEAIIKAKVAEDKWTCNVDVFGRNWESSLVSYYTEQVCDFRDTRPMTKSAKAENLNDFSKPTVAFVDRLFDWKRRGNINVENRIDVGSPRRYESKVTKATKEVTKKQIRSIFFPTCYNDIVILQILPKYGIFVNLILTQPSFTSCQEFWGGWNVTVDTAIKDEVDVILRYTVLSKLGHYEPICPDFLDEIPSV